MLKFIILIGLLCPNVVVLSLNSSTPTIGSECDAESPPVIPNSFQKLMTKLMDPSGQSCKAANAFSNIEDKLCTGVLSRMPKFAFNPKNPNPDMFCQFLDLFPIGKVAGRSTCNAIVDCVIRNIKGRHGNLERECGTDILKGLAKDVEKKMSDWTNTLSGVASIANDATTSFLETVGCGKDPSSEISESISAIGKIFKGLTNYHSQLETMFKILPEIMKVKPEEFYNSLGTDDDKEKDYFSFLMGPGMSIQIGNTEISKNLGVFVTVPIEVLKRCAYSYAVKSKVGDCLKNMDIYEIGIYEAFGAGLTSNFGVSKGVKNGMEFLHGTSNKWGGFGFGISIGGGPKVFVAEAGGEFGLVFSALESGGRQYMDEFIGFNVYINAGAGPEVPIPVTVSVGCAVAKVSTPQKCKKPEPPKCPNQNWKEMINKLKQTGEQMSQDWVDLYNSCKSHWGKKWKKCNSAANNYAEAFKGCGKGFMKKCASFKSDYCQEGKWKEATKTCEKFHEKKGECKIWNTRKYCDIYGEKQDSCRTWNTRKYCGQFDQKRSSCRTWNTQKYCGQFDQKRSSCKTWNTRKYCGQYGEKKKCDWVKKGTNWSRIPYPCGTKWCKKGWFKYPCGVKICHRNIAKDVMGWSCKMVTDTARCLRHVVQNTSCRSWNMVKDTSRCLRYVVKNTSCRSWNMVKDTSRCLRHVVENTSCKSWNMVKDTAKCLKHIVENTTCQTWHMVEDITKCASGWIITPGKCMVDTVGHCSKWEETCTKNLVMSNNDMFKNCGANMLPYVPA